MMKLYDYYRSTACYRVRIALNLKKLEYEKIPVHLVQQGGEQHLPAYRNINPQGLVPALDTGEGVLSQSLAIIEYLDEQYPEPPLLPANPIERAEARRLAQMIACDIHPLNNLRVLNQLKTQFKADDEQVNLWYHHWLKEGFTALERLLSAMERKGPYCLGASITVADICLVPQVYNANRYAFSLDDFPVIEQINAACLGHPAFTESHP